MPIDIDYDRIIGEIRQLCEKTPRTEATKNTILIHWNKLPASLKSKELRNMVKEATGRGKKYKDRGR